MKRRSIQPGTLRFIFIAVVLMLLMDHFVFGGKRSYIEDAKTARIVEQQEETAAMPKEPPVKVEPEQGEYFEFIPEEPDIVTVPDTPVPEEPAKVEKKPEEKKAEKPVPVSPPSVKGAKIAIIIDDVGMDLKHSHQVINDLPAPVTLAFLPYAPKTRELAADAKAKGHELIIHTPMEAMDGTLNIGPGGLKEAMSPAEMEVAFKVMLASFEGYVGINNHMGSRLTQDKAKMDELMGIIAAHKLFFVDSKTIQSSVAAREAAQAGVPYAERDVFLDHVESRDFVDKALLHTEKLALKRGYAIAIGHPKSFTIEGLKAWIPTLAAKGIELVPVSRLLTTPTVTAAIPKPQGEDSLRVPERENIPPSAAPPFAMTGGEVEAPSVGMTEKADIVPMEERPDVPAPVPSVDMFPEEGLNTTVPVEPSSEGPVLWHPPQPTQSPAP